MKALKKSLDLRKRSTMTNESHIHKDSVSNSKNILTLTLIIIVLCYLLLVTPAEVLLFWDGLMTDCTVSKMAADVYSVTLTVCNALQAINFAFNFILYCIINVHFRKVVIFS